MFVVVPHIVRTQQLDQANLRVIDTGEGQSIDLRHPRTGIPGALPLTSLPAVRPAALQQPSSPAPDHCQLDTGAGCDRGCSANAGAVEIGHVGEWAAQAIPHK